MINVFIQIVACKLQNLFSVIYDLLRGKKTAPLKIKISWEKNNRLRLSHGNDEKFFRNFAHRKVSMASWLEHRSAESEGLSFDSMGTQTFFPQSHVRDKTQKKKKPFSILKKFSRAPGPILLSFPFLIFSKSFPGAEYILRRTKVSRGNVIR